MRKIKPSKERVVMGKPVMGGEIIGGIHLPETRTRTFIIGSIHSLGDDAKGRGFDEGDHVVFQTNRMYQATITHMLDDETLYMIHYKDVIGKLSSAVMTKENFTIVGDWVLVRTEAKDSVGTIYLPDNSELSAATAVHFVDSIGPDVTEDRVFNVGDEVFVDMSRNTPITFEGTTEKLGFVDPGYIHGIVCPSEEHVPALG